MRASHDGSHSPTPGRKPRSGMNASKVTWDRAHRLGPSAASSPPGRPRWQDARRTRPSRSTARGRTNSQADPTPRRTPPARHEIPQEPRGGHAGRIRPPPRAPARPAMSARARRFRPMTRRGPRLMRTATRPRVRTRALGCAVQRPDRSPRPNPPPPPAPESRATRPWKPTSHRAGQPRGAHPGPGPPR